MGQKGKLDPAKKEEMFNAWKASPEYHSIEKFIAKRGEIPRLELSDKDISYDF